MAEFQSAEKDGVHVVSCPPTLGEHDASTMESIVKTWLLSPSKVHVLDFKDVVNFKPTGYRAFVLYNQALRGNGKNLYVVNVNPMMQAQLNEDGLSSVFVTVASVEEAKKKAQPAKTQVDVEFINPFISAARNVLETQANIKITPGKPSIKKPGDKLPMEIAGMLAMSCDQFTGSINLCFRAEVFLRMYESLTGEKHTEINSEIEDAAAELLNIIFGQAKTVLNDEKGFTLDRAIPSVLTGDRLKVHHQGTGPVIAIPFESSIGAFHLEIVIEKT